MSKKLDARLSEIDRKFGLSTEDDDDEEGTVEERKRKKKKTEEVREVILREGVTAVFDKDSGLAYITLDEAELDLDDRLSEVDARHGVRVG